MEALVNTAYDRISEDVILLYDAMLAYNQVSYKPGAVHTKNRSTIICYIAFSIIS